MEPVSSGFMLDVRRLRVLQELRQRGTVAATAAALHLTPSAISQQLASLSREAGVPLLARQGRGVRLTPQAHLLLEHAAAVQAQLERARADLAAYEDGRVGYVAVGAFATAISGLVAPALPALRRERPRLQLTVLEIEAPDCFTRLDVGDLDVVITVGYRDGPHRADPRYHRCDLLSDPFDAVLPRDHPLAGDDSIELADLADLPWTTGAPGGPCSEVTVAACASAGFNPNVSHYAHDWDAAIALVAAGAGVALVPRLVTATRNLSGVILRPITPSPPARHIYAAVRAGAGHSPVLAPVLSALQTQAAQASV